MVSNSPTIVPSPLTKYKKKKSITGSIPTLIESVMEHPDDDDDAAEEEERGHEFVEVGSVPKNVGSTFRKSSLAFLPKNRKGSLGLSSLFSTSKNKLDTSASKEVEDDCEISPLPPPRRSSIAALEGRSRRKSWATKLQIDRRRRQSGGEDDNSLPGDTREKRRPSWWVNLVPDNLLKTR